MKKKQMIRLDVFLSVILRLFSILGIIFALPVLWYAAKWVHFQVAYLEYLVQ